MTLLSIGAVVLGGTALSGGSGGVLGRSRRADHRADEQFVFFADLPYADAGSGAGRDPAGALGRRRARVEASVNGSAPSCAQPLSSRSS